MYFVLSRKQSNPHHLEKVGFCNVIVLIRPQMHKTSELISRNNNCSTLERTETTNGLVAALEKE